MNKITFADAIGLGFKNYSNFRGVASRAEYWYWVLFTVLLRAVLSTIDGFITGGLLATFVTGLLIVPGMTILIRRYRDAGFSPWLVLLWLVPIFAMVGFLAYFIPDFQGSTLSALTPTELNAALVTFQDAGTGPIADAIDAGVFDNALIFAFAFVGSFLLVGLFSFVVTVLPSKAQKPSKKASQPDVTDFQVKL